MIHFMFAFMLCAGCSGELVITSSSAALDAPCSVADESAETARSLCGFVSGSWREMEACHRAMFAPGIRVTIRTCGDTRTLTAGTWSAELRLP